MPTTVYGDLTIKVMPAIVSDNQFFDTQLSITFDNAPTFGSLGEYVFINKTTTP